MDRADREALVSRSIDAWNADDREDQLRQIWSPEGTIVAPEGWPEAGEFKGWDAMVGEWRRLKGSWAAERVDLLELESIGERVLASLHWSMQGEVSGAPLQVEAWLVAETEDDKLTKMAYFLDRESAQTAAEAGI